MISCDSTLNTYILLTSHFEIICEDFNHKTKISGQDRDNDRTETMTRQGRTGQRPGQDS